MPCGVHIPRGGLVLTGDDSARAVDLTSVFTPHTPIDLPEFLYGRQALLYRITDAVNTAGLHVILFGDRGTGKTSIAKVVAREVQQPGPNGRRVLYVSCNSSDDFTSIWRRVFQEVLLVPKQLGFRPNPDDIAVARLDQSGLADPNDVRLLVAGMPNPLVIVIDEFDRVPVDNSARRLMADTIKLFADLDVRATIVIVGVAESIAELFAEHQSITRNTAQVPVQPMTVEELETIVTRGFSRVGMTVDDGLASRIAELSQGYPSYTHLLGLWAGRRTLEEGRRHVSMGDLDRGIPDALKNVTGGAAQEYEQGIESNQPGNLFGDVLLACAIAPKDSLGRFSAKSVQEPLKLVTGVTYATGAYQSHLAKFCEARRGPMLRKSGSRRSYKWRFVNPQIIPYILLRGERQGRLPIDRGGVATSPPLPS
jgi:AAA ATPase domain